MAFGIPLLLCIGLFASQAQLTYEEAWQKEQKERGILQATLFNPGSDAATLRKAIKGLEELKAWCERPEIRDLKSESGVRQVYYQRYDILTDLIRGYARLKETPTVVRLVIQLRDELSAPDSYLLGNKRAMFSFYANVLEGYPELKPLLNQPEIRDVIVLFRSRDPLSMLRTVPYETVDADQISSVDRIAGLSVIWSEAKYNFANFDLVQGLDWDEAYRAYLPKVQAASSRYAYYNLLREFTALLKDSHTDVWIPSSLRSQHEVHVSLRTKLVEGKVVVGGEPPAVLAQQGIRKGDVIKSIDGVDAVVYGRQQWGNRVSASTPQDADVRMYTYMLLAGPPKKKVRLELEGVGGPRTITVSRDPKVKLAWQPYQFKILPDGTAYFVFNTCEDPGVSAAFVSLLPKIKEAGRLVIDCRENGGGSSDIGYEILSHLIDRKVEVSKSETRVYRPSLRTGWSNAGSLEPFSDSVKPSPDPFLGPVVVLQSAQTFSAAEDFLVAFKMSKRGPMIGMPSGGSTGQPIFFRLPGGGGFRICSKRDRMPDGVEFVGAGVKPDVRVPETIEALRSGRDLVLEEAVRRLKAGSR